MRIKRIIAALSASAVMIAASAVTAYAELPAPSKVSATKGSTTVTVKWDKVEGADAYDVLKYDDAQKKYVSVKQVTGTSYRITGLKPSSKYKIKIAVYDKVDGKLVKQSETAAQTVSTTAAPSSVSLSDSSKTVNKGKSATVTAKVTPAEFKDVKWTVSDSSIAKIASSGTSCKITGLKAGKVTVTADAGGKKAKCSVTVKAGASSSDSKASSVKNFEYTVNNGEVTITAYKGSEENVVIPAYIGGKPVTTIGLQAFSRNSKLRTVTLPDTLVTIGDGAFQMCPMLESVTIPDSVKKLGVSAFQVSGISSLTIGSGLETIGWGAFYDCKHLENLTIPDTVKVIEGGAFGYCSGLKTVTIGKNVTEIGDGAFYGCREIETLTFKGKKLKTIGDNAFGDLYYATVELPSSVNSVKENAFGYAHVKYKGKTYYGDELMDAVNGK